MGCGRVRLPWRRSPVFSIFSLCAVAVLAAFFLGVDHARRLDLGNPSRLERAHHKTAIGPRPWHSAILKKSRPCRARQRPTPSHLVSARLYPPVSSPLHSAASNCPLAKIPSHYDLLPRDPKHSKHQAIDSPNISQTLNGVIKVIQGPTFVKRCDPDSPLGSTPAKSPSSQQPAPI